MATACQKIRGLPQNGSNCSRKMRKSEKQNGKHQLKLSSKTLLLILLAGLVFALPPAFAAPAESSWSRDELWDLFRFGRLQTVKEAIIKNPKLINMHDPFNQMTPLH